MVKKLLKEKGFQTAKWVVRKLIERRLIENEGDANAKLSDVRWIASHGFGHVADLLMSETGRQAISEVFRDRERQSTET